MQTCFNVFSKLIILNKQQHKNYQFPVHFQNYSSNWQYHLNEQTSYQLLRADQPQKQNSLKYRKRAPCDETIGPSTLASLSQWASRLLREHIRQQETYILSLPCTWYSEAANFLKVAHTSQLESYDSYSCKLSLLKAYRPETITTTSGKEFQTNDMLGKFWWLSPGSVVVWGEGGTTLAVLWITRRTFHTTISCSDRSL